MSKLEIKSRRGEDIATTEQYHSLTEWVRSGDLRAANLSYANLSDADLSDANLRYADLSDANLRAANLRAANLSAADLSAANLRDANLSAADLRAADLRAANLRDANLSDADLRDADLRDANLSYANLSGVKGLLDPVEWLKANFESDALGVIVYKRIGGKTEFDAPSHWAVEPGAYLTEVVNPTRTLECACGVNFGTRDWCRWHYEMATLWRCRIEWWDLAGVVVPYNTDGKARCERLRLIEPVIE